MIIIFQTTSAVQRPDSGVPAPPAQHPQQSLLQDHHQPEPQRHHRVRAPGPGGEDKILKAMSLPLESGR